MDHFELVSPYKPTGDQPQAVEELVKGFQNGNQFQPLLGVTGSGKTFTMANLKSFFRIIHNSERDSFCKCPKFDVVDGLHKRCVIFLNSCYNRNIEVVVMVLEMIAESHYRIKEVLLWLHLAYLQVLI